MVLDQMNMENFQSVGGYNPHRTGEKNKGRGHKKIRPRSLRLLSYIKKNRRHTKRNKHFKKRNKKYTKRVKTRKGGSLMAHVSVPSSLLLFNQFFKNRKTQENKRKFNKSNKSKKSKKK